VFIGQQESIQHVISTAKATPIPVLLLETNLIWSGFRKTGRSKTDYVSTDSFYTFRSAYSRILVNVANVKEI